MVFGQTCFFGINPYRFRDPSPPKDRNTNRWRLEEVTNKVGSALNEALETWALNVFFFVCFIRLRLFSKHIIYKMMYSRFLFLLVIMLCFFFQLFCILDVSFFWLFLCNTFFFHCVSLIFFGVGLA